MPAQVAGRPREGKGEGPRRCAGAGAQAPDPAEVDELEREREERRSEFLAAQEARQAEALKRINAENNALNRRVPARS